MTRLHLRSSMGPISQYYVKAKRVSLLYAFSHSYSCPTTIMTDALDNLFNSPPGQSSRPPRPRTPSPSPSPERRRLSSQPLFLSPNGTATPIRTRQPPAGQRPPNAQVERREEVQRRMIYSPEAEIDPFEENVTTGNLGVYDPLAPILGDEEPARKKRKPIPKIDAER
jgi:hypothetical protein